MQETATPETPTKPVNPNKVQPALFVGDEQHDARIVMRRFFICVECILPDKRTEDCIPIEELPLRRVLYRYYGGKVVIRGAAQHDAVTMHLKCQELNAYQWQNVLRNHRRTYAKVQIGKQVFEVFKEVYGEGEQCSLIPKMHSLASEWNGSYDPDHIEALITRHFPHISQTSRSDVIALPGSELGAPVIGAAAGTVSDLDGQPPKTIPAQEPNPLRTPVAPMMDLDPMLVQFLMSPEKCDGEAFSEDQAKAIAALSTKKPAIEFLPTDMKTVPDLTGRNLPRIVRLVDAYFASMTPPGFASDGSVEDALSHADSPEMSPEGSMDGQELAPDASAEE